MPKFPCSFTRLILPLLGYLALAPAPPAQAASLPDGHFVVADAASCSSGGPGNGVFVVDPDTGARTPIATGGDFVCASGVALEGDGSILVVDQLAFQEGALFRVDSESGMTEVVTSGGLLSLPFRVIVDIDGHYIVTNIGDGPQDGNGSIVRVDRVSGAQTLISMGNLLSDSTATVVAADGNYLVADFDNGLVEVDRDSGAQSLLFAFEGLTDLASLDDETLVATVFLTAEVVRIDLVAGTTAVLTQGDNIFGGEGIAVEADGTIVVVDRFCCGGGGPFIRVDPGDGTQTVVDALGFQDAVGIAIVGGSSDVPASSSPSLIALVVGVLLGSALLLGRSPPLN